jgi:hypothetical protein
MAIPAAVRVGTSRSVAPVRRDWPIDSTDVQRILLQAQNVWLFFGIWRCASGRRWLQRPGGPLAVREGAPRLMST